MSLLIIDNYDSFTYNLVQSVEQAGNIDFQVVKNDRLMKISSGSFEKVLISPGPGVAEEAGDLMKFIAAFYKTKSFFGVCLGFEALLSFFGARLSLLPAPLHGIQNKGLVMKNDRLFKNMPVSFDIGHYHSWYVKENDFPAGFDILMKDEAGRIMAFRHRKFFLYGVQFHPESYMTTLGDEIIKNWLEM